MKDKQYVGFVLLLGINSHFASFDSVDNWNYSQIKMTYYELDTNPSPAVPLKAVHTKDDNYKVLIIVLNL